MSTEDRLELLIARLRQNKPGNPSSVASLRNAIVSHFRQQITDVQAGEVVKGLVGVGGADDQRPEDRVSLSEVFVQY